MRFTPSQEYLAGSLWQTRIEFISSKCTFDRWYEALLKEHIWHQWMFIGLEESMDIPTRNTLAPSHLDVNAKHRKTSRICKERSVFLAQQRSESFQYYIISCGLISFLRCRRPTRSSGAREKVFLVPSTAPKPLPPMLPPQSQRSWNRGRERL